MPIKPDCTTIPLPKKCFSKIRVRESDKVKEIYLSDAELQALYEMSLEGLEVPKIYEKLKLFRFSYSGIILYF